MSKPTEKAIAQPQGQMTSLIHHPYEAPEGFDAVQPAIHKASTVIFPDVASMHMLNWGFGTH